MILSSFGRRLLAAANGTVAGTIIGLGTAAFKNTGTSGNTVPLLDGANTWSAIQTFSANPSVTGGAISFPATQVASSGANDLDDYEEGSWTPTVTFGGGSTGITYSAQEGTYTKIGRMVFVRGRVTMTNKGSSTGTALITGLPFTASTAFPIFVGYYALMSGLVDSIVGYVGNTSVNPCTGNAATAAALTNTNFTNGSDIVFSSVYQV